MMLQKGWSLSCILKKDMEVKWGRVCLAEGTACAKAGKTGRAWKVGECFGMEGCVLMTGGRCRQELDYTCPGELLGSPGVSRRFCGQGPGL